MLVSLALGLACQFCTPFQSESSAPGVYRAAQSSAPQAQASPQVPRQAPEWIGCWIDAGDSGEVLLFEAQRCGRLREKVPAFFRTDYTEKEAHLESWGNLTTLGLALDDGGLAVQEGDQTRRFVPLDKLPKGLAVEPYELPAVFELDQDTVDVLCQDLGQRRAEDQRVRIQAGAASEMHSVDQDNTAFLLSIIQEIGWIDVTRFGEEASDAAFLLVQHSSDLRLLRTALPFILADVDAKRLDGQAFALLFDRLQLRLGYKQRFGSQIAILADRVSVLMPCEDPARVDELRASMGMGPLAEYLALFESEGDKVRPLGEVLGH